MKCITPGHQYILDKFEPSDEPNPIFNFIHKEPVKEGSLELKTITNGTTNEEVLKMLIDRLYYLNQKFPCRENSIVITKLEESLMWLDKRTADRVARGVEGKQIK